jgi:hypothetical protein
MPLHKSAVMDATPNLGGYRMIASPNETLRLKYKQRKYGELAKVCLLAARYIFCALRH